MDFVRHVVTWLAVLLLLLVTGFLLIGLMPVANHSDESNPDLTRRYSDAVNAIDHLQDAERSTVNASSRSIFLTHGEKTENAYVLIHGLGNAPKEFAELAQLLHEQGDNVIVLRMPFHGLNGLDMQALDALTPDIVRDYADEIVDLAHGLGNNVTIIGISGGGTVAAWIAQNRADVARVIVISPFLGIRYVPTFLDPLVKNALTRLPKFAINGAPQADRNWMYRGVSSNGVAVYMTVGQSVFTAAQAHPPAVKELFVVTTAIDAFVDNRWAQRLAAAWRAGGADVRTHEFEKALAVPHASVDPFTDPSKRQLVYDQIAAWLNDAE